MEFLGKFCKKRLFRGGKIDMICKNYGGGLEN